MKLPVFDCLINENLEDESGIYAISFVDIPANEVDFVTLSAQKAKQELLCRDPKKQILTGVVLRPEQLIYRNDKNLEEYYIRFGAEEIEKIARKMMKSGVALHNTTHQHQQNLKGNYLTELWIVEDPEKDKSLALGFDPQTKGTLMCSYKIEDKTYWDTEIMTGNVRGFSLEGLFFQQSENSDNNKINKKTMNKNSKKTQQSFLSKLTHFFLDIANVEKNDTTVSGTAYVIFTLSDGKDVLVDSDGFATLDGEQLPSGEHVLSNGNILVVDEQGQFIETKESAVKNQEPEQAVASQTLSNDAATEENENEEKVDSDKENSPEILKAKIAELEEKLSELATLAQEANAEVQNLRKVTPSTLPATSEKSKNTVMKRHERMAYTLSQSMKVRNKTNQ